MDYKQKVVREGDIHYHNTEKADIRFQDGGLRHVVGASHYQVIRACKDRNLAPEGMGWTYNHAPMLVYWNNHFLIEYLSGESGEHIPPSAAFLCISEDGVHWKKPKCVFPAISVPTKYYQGPGKELLTNKEVHCIIHHRMGFYVAANKKLLVSSFYGICPVCNIAPNNGYGVGRVVREIKEDFSFGGIYFIRYNPNGGYTQDNTHVFPFFQECKDVEFVKACDELLENRLVTQQWWEEERLDTEFFTRPGAQAISYYTLPDGNVMAVFKNAFTSISRDGGETWSTLKKSYSIETANGKVWGQKTSDGRYALVYNPSTDGTHRWPLALVTGNNGVDFDNLMAVTPEVSPCRYEGMFKNLGPQYIRGICESNPVNPDGAMWLTYSVNKEDIWISKVPIPVCPNEPCDLDEDFRTCRGKWDESWNLYVPAWGSAEVREQPIGKCLFLSDWDPYNRVNAERMFVPAVVTRIDTKVMVEKLFDPSVFTIELQDCHGACPVKLIIRPDGVLYARIAGMDHEISSVKSSQWLDISIMADCVKNRAFIQVAQETKVDEKEIAFAQSVHRLERIVYRTKEILPFQNLEANGKYANIGNLPDADESHPACEIYIQTLKTRTLHAD